MYLKDIVGRTLNKGGCTLSLWYGDMAGRPYYSVGVRNTGIIIPVVSFLESDLELFVRTAEVSYHIGSPLCALGIWIYKADIYIDAVHLLSKDTYNLNDVRKMIEMNNQKCAWDLEYSKPICLI